MMADAQRDDDEIFVYMGGDQEVPDGVVRARIHKSVKIVPARAFYRREQLIYVEFHDDIDIIEEVAFAGCESLKGPIKLLGVKIIKMQAFQFCSGLTDVEFGDKLETIEQWAFNGCESLTNVKMPSARTIGRWAFASCCDLSDVEFGEGLRTLQEGAFAGCRKLKHIVLPLKRGMIQGDVFNGCSELTTVELVDGIHSTVASLHLETWRSEMNNEIYQINQTLPTIGRARKTAEINHIYQILPTIIGDKTPEIQQWMESAIRRLDHYKTEHHALLKEATTLLELALWKANLADNGGGEGEGVRTAGEVERAREEFRVTSGADIVIKNVLPFLVLKS